VAIKPAYLQQGDKIGICAPSGSVTNETMQAMIQQLEFWGFEVVLGKTIGTTWGTFSGTDQERLKDFQDMLDDDSIKAILFARGGYGFVRIIDYVRWEKFKQKPKWLVGYSDVTVLHNHVHRHVGVATIHAHMSGGYNQGHFDNESLMSIYYTLTGKTSSYEIKTTAQSETVSCRGELCGGNLAIISDLTGTISDIDTAGKILVLEDVSEYRYNIDRMMWQLLRSGKLHHLAGLIVGGFTDTKDNEIPFPMNEYEIIWEKVEQFSFPVCFGFPVGHQARNVALKFGVQHQLTMGGDTVRLEELV
jgi:muramoyltetrapeptide carboxypeptidase